MPKDSEHREHLWALASQGKNRWYGVVWYGATQTQQRAAEHAECDEREVANEGSARDYDKRGQRSLWHAQEWWEERASEDNACATTDGDTHSWRDHLHSDALKCLH